MFTVSESSFVTVFCKFGDVCFGKDILVWFVLETFSPTILHTMNTTPLPVFRGRVKRSKSGEAKAESSSSVITFFPISEFSCKLIRFIFHSSDNEIGKNSYLGMENPRATRPEEGERKDISPRERSTYPRYLDYLLMDHLQLSLRVGERDVRFLKRKVHL